MRGGVRTPGTAPDPNRPYDPAEDGTARSRPNIRRPAGTGLAGTPIGPARTARPGHPPTARPERRHFPPRRSPTPTLISPAAARRDPADITLPARPSAGGSDSGGADRSHRPSPTRPGRASLHPIGWRIIEGMLSVMRLPQSPNFSFSLYLLGCTGFAKIEMHLSRSRSGLASQVAIGFGFKIFQRFFKFHDSRPAGTGTGQA